MPVQVTTLVATQAGVVSRRQLLAAGASDVDIRSWRRRRLLRTVHPGVYADRTGELDWHQRAWAAVLLSAPAALQGRSVLTWHRIGVRGRDARREEIHVAVEAGRHLRVPDGVVLRRARVVADRLDRSAGIPRQRLEEAVLDVAAAASELDAVAVLAEAVGSRRTTAPRIARALSDRPRIEHRELLGGILADIAAGACSVIERAYLRDVERAHGLPTAERQVRASLRGTVFRDVEYAGLGVVVELDGRLDHTSVADRDRDLDRDLDAAVTGRVTVRLGAGQVLGRPCATAVRLGALLTARGWDGAPVSCGRC